MFFAISSKYIFTFNGKHVFNPSLIGIVLSLLITNEFITAAPAYQWNGIPSMSMLIIMPATLLIMPGINRHWLVISWLLTFTAEIALRSVLLKYYLPPTTLFLGTITSPAFFLFTFFMITDPATSPGTKRGQIIAGISLGILDLLYHLMSSYHTYFYAAATVGCARILYLHYTAIARTTLYVYVYTRFIQSGYAKKLIIILGTGILCFSAYTLATGGAATITKPGFHFENISAARTGFEFSKGTIIEETDPRVQHMAKWLLAITDGVAVADVNNDGLMDIFFTNPHKSAADRNALFINKGDFAFERLPQDQLSKYAGDYRYYGVAANGMFLDYDNDGDQDLYICYAFGRHGSSLLFENSFMQTGKVEFTNRTGELGLSRFTNAATANFLDFNRDGRLDIIVGNTIALYLPDYDTPTRLDIFSLPQAKYDGDRRMFNFMHESWHMAENGGVNLLFVSEGKGFRLLDAEVTGMPETKWSMAIATADFNQDGFTDLYVANDFGSDDLYYNQGGNRFRRVQGYFFGSIGKDTYKGMNATIADFDRNGWSDVYISNVHHPLQAEGSLLWTFSKGRNDDEPEIDEQATYLGVLNENRFGWGAAAADFNNDGWIDLAQANGMVDDIWDKQETECPDYWYINEKIARSPPSIHRYIDNWGDIRGKCIYGHEKNRLYINRGNSKRPQFIDVADAVGMSQTGNWRGMAAADFNNDGHMDLVASSLFRNPLVLKNTVTDNAENSWIGFRLVSNRPGCNRDAIGTRMTVTYRDASPDLQHQNIEKTAVNGFSAQNDPRIHIGLGKDPVIAGITINWCGTDRVDYEPMATNTYHLIELD